jgi:dTDP-4-dehydrorhamnose reductase
MAGEHRILLFGANGQVGWELRSALGPLGAVRALARAEADLCEPDSLVSAIRGMAPTLIVNAAAYTAVDRAEDTDEEKTAIAANTTAPGILAEEAKRLGAAMVHYSTDYVFDGTRPVRPEDPAAWYREEDATGPLNVYGRTKLAGETAVLDTGVPALVFRTSWVYSLRGRNFLRTVLNLAAGRDTLSMVADQHGAPTWARAIAQATALVIARWGTGGGVDPSRRGIYHMTAAGATTWHGFATAIVRHAASSGQPLACAPGAIKPIPSDAFPTAATRPKNSLLSNERLHRAFGIALPHWETSLSLCLEDGWCTLPAGVPTNR